METTLNAIRAKGPCADGWSKLLRNLGKTCADDEPLSLTTILDSNGFDDAVWCLRAVVGHDKEIRLFAVWCARQAQHLMEDERSVTALDIAEKFARGEVTSDELATAKCDAYAAYANAADASYAADAVDASYAAYAVANAADAYTVANAADAAAYAAGFNESVAKLLEEKFRELISSSSQSRY